MTRAVLSIGSNLGDRITHLQSAVDAMRPWLRAVSPVYETPPWGPVPQDDYLNAVLVVEDSAAAPSDWLIRAHAAENAAGRTRELRWGPRTLDVDIVCVDDIESDDPALTLPHPRAAERAFVLVPLLAIAPRATIRGRTVRCLLDEVDVTGVRARPDLAVS